MKAMSESPISKYLIYALLIGIVVCAGVLYYRTRFMQQASDTTKKSIEDASPTNGTLTLIPLDDRTVYNPGEDITVMVYADSAGESISGYDFVFDTTADGLALKDAESLIESFTLFPSSQDDFISISGVQDLQNLTPVTFANEPIAQLTFTAPKKGPWPLNLRFIQGETSDSNLVNADAQDILGKAVGVDLYVGSTITLQKGAEVVIEPDTTLLLEKVIIPSDTCQDCVTEAYVRVNDEALVFSFGGLTGARTSTMETETHVFTATEVTAQSLVISYEALK